MATSALRRKTLPETLITAAPHFGPVRELHSRFLGLPLNTQIVNVYDLRETSLDEDLRVLRVRLGIATAFIVIVTAVGTVGYRLFSPETS